MPAANTEMAAREKICEFGKKNQNLKVCRGAEERFLRLCELADVLGEEFGTEQIRVNIDNETSDGVICVDTDDLVFEYGRSHPFYEYIKQSDFLHFSKTKSGMLRTCFGVRGLWVER
ncbi:hypothetical protein [Flavonifractor plautii]|uniref:hypothetical protein n=1 Tax=Flavonifractor plautii TaxID=292800 RepID=UPI0018AABCE1|nr:hypothetical protein [Flavonifractor plautii]